MAIETGSTRIADEAVAEHLQFAVVCSDDHLLLEQIGGTGVSLEWHCRLTNNDLRRMGRE